MKNSYKFYSNKECFYFPCHKIKEENESKFNCMFCFCPLYLMGTECGGNYKYIEEIKDCSDCFIPHKEDAHTIIVGKLFKENDFKKRGQ